MRETLAVRSEPMIVVSVHNSADLYGASRSLLEMLRLLAEDRHEVHVVLPERGPLAERLRAGGIEVHVFPGLAVAERRQLQTIWGAVCFPFRYAASVAWLCGLIVRLRANVVHTNTAVLPAPGMAALLTGRRHLWHIREVFSEFPRVWRIYQRYIWMVSDRIAAISRAVEGQFAPALRGRCVLSHNDLDAEGMEVDREAARRFRAAAGNPEVLIGVVGRIKWRRKGQEVLVRAAAMLAERYPEARYAIVGSPAEGNEDHLERLQALVTECGLKGRVYFAGEVGEARDVYAAFDVTVVPSILPEPFGRVVMESMAAGTPVVGSRCGGIPEQIVDGVTGLLFEPGDVAGLAAALERMIVDREGRQRMGEAGQERMWSRCDRGAKLKLYREVFGLDGVSRAEAYGVRSGRRPSTGKRPVG